MKSIIAERIRHEGGMRVALRFPYDREIIKLVRTLPDARWNNRMGCWHIAEGKNIDSTIITKLADVARIEFRSRRTNKVIDWGRDFRQRDNSDQYRKDQIASQQPHGEHMLEPEDLIVTACCLL